jgi:hypothetical protein
LTGRDRGRAVVDVWVRRGCAVVVALVAAYASYEHQRVFALRGGADTTSAGLWPLSVDGLLLLASTALIRGSGRSRRSRWVVWAAFGLGIAVSLAANIASAPVLGWQPILVAGWPPVSLLLAVELVSHRSARRDSVSPSESAAETRREQPADRAEDVMWAHFQSERSRGRTPTGAELDRVAGTNNYGRAVVRRWQRGGRLASVGLSGDGQLTAAVG